MRWSRRLALTFALTMFALIGLFALSGASARVAPLRAAQLSARSVAAHIGSGRPTARPSIRNGRIKPDTTWAFWLYYGDPTYCAYDSGGYTGAWVEIQPNCNAIYNNQWTAVLFGSGAWAGYYQLKSEDGLCADDVNGADNVHITMQTCAEIGGQSWSCQNCGDPGQTFLNAIRYAAGNPPYEAITLDYGTVKDGGWVVSNPHNWAPSYPTSMRWNGP